MPDNNRNICCIVKIGRNHQNCHGRFTTYNDNGVTVACDSSESSSDRQIHGWIHYRAFADVLHPKTLQALWTHHRWPRIHRFFRPKKKNCLFWVTSWKMVGRVGWLGIFLQGGGWGEIFLYLYSVQWQYSVCKQAWFHRRNAKNTWYHTVYSETCA